MRVLYFHQHFTTPRGATGTRSYEMAKRLLAAGHDVTMVCGSYGLATTGLDGPFKRGKRSGMVDGIQIIEFDLRYSNSDGFLKRSWTFARYAIGSTLVALRKPHDIAFATTTPLTVAIPVILGRWFKQQHYVFEVRDLWPELPKAMGAITNPVVLSLLDLLESLAYRNAHRLIALAPGIADGIERKGVKREKIALIPNGCDLSLFSELSEPTTFEGVSPGDFVAVFTGTHGQANGLSAVLDAAAELRKRGRDDIKLVLVGDGKEKSGLQARAVAERLDSVIFVDPVSKVEIPKVFARADLGLQILANVPAFYYGTSPNKFFDYLAAGLPVLCNYPGWVSDLLTENQCGYAVPPDDPKAFADALERAASDRDELAAMAGASRRLAERDFARDTLGERWVEWLSKTGGPVPV